MSSNPRPERHRLSLPRSLTGRLIATVLLLVALVTVLVGAVTTLALRQFLMSRLDAQLVAASNRHEGAPRSADGDGDVVGGPVGSAFPCAVQPPGQGPGLGFGQAAGTLLGRFDPRCRSVVLVTEDGSLRALGRAAVSTLGALAPSSRPQSVELPGDGSYRVIVRREAGWTSVTGLGTHDVSDTLGSVVAWESALVLGGVLLAAAIGQALVRRQLRPLLRVAATATEVTSLPLESGEVGVTARVPAELTDPSTEVGQVGAALNSMLGHVERALDTRHESEQRVRQFLADASHELRTPLSTIMGYAELTRRTPEDAATMTHAMGRIQAESGRMGSLVNDLLLLARLDSGRPLDRAVVDVSRQLVEAVNDARVVSPDHRWRLTVPPEPLQVMGDRDRLHQVFSNVLSNAIRHTPRGTTVSVSVSVAVAGTRSVDGAGADVEIKIQDDGPGMPRSMAGKEFERFSRADTSRTRTSGGAGLGLSIVQAIVLAHGGAVDITSSDRGTTVAICLPSPTDLR